MFSCTDLGVCINSVLSFSDHINNVVVKAKQRTSLLLRSFLSKDPMLLILKRLSLLFMYALCSSTVHLSGHLAVLVTLIN